MLAGASRILSVVGAWTGQAAVVIGQVGVVRSRTVNHALPGRLVSVHHWSTRTVFFTIMSSIISEEVRRAELYTGTDIQRQSKLLRFATTSALT